MTSTVPIAVSSHPASIPAFVALLRQMPPGTLLTAAGIVETLEQMDSAPVQAVALVQPPTSSGPASWREKLWTVPAETRLGVVEVAEACGHPRSWVYRRTGERCGAGRIPHRRLDGELVFVAGELRAWLGEHEEVIARPVLTMTTSRPRSA